MKRVFVQRLEDGNYIVTVTSGEHTRAEFGSVPLRYTKEELPDGLQALGADKNTARHKVDEAAANGLCFIDLR